jgi:pimeloyl-ACP methyl ester carboxylesterase
MATIERDSISIHFESTGEGRPVVFLHGWTMDYELWDRQVTSQLGPGKTSTNKTKRGIKNTPSKRGLKIN